MFVGQVLTTQGWSFPAEGQIIACLYPETDRMVWTPIGEVSQRRDEVVTVHSSLLHYSISLDHEILIRTRHPDGPFSIRTGDAIYRAVSALNRKTRNVVRWHHTVHAYPAERYGVQGERFVQGPDLSIVDPRAKQLLQWGINLGTYAASRTHLKPASMPEYYRMGAQDAAEALSILYAWVSRSRTIRTWRFRASDPGLVQAVLLMNGVYSRCEGDTVYVWQGTRRSNRPVRPIIPTRSTVSLSQGWGYDIGASRPFVRNTGQVVVL